MDDESLEDTYDWLDDDEHYPLDPTHVFGWKQWGTDEVWLQPVCEEHNTVVRDQRTAQVTSSEQEKWTWIAENRERLTKKCVEIQKVKRAKESLSRITQMSQVQMPGQNPTWPQP